MGRAKRVCFFTPQGWRWAPWAHSNCVSVKFTVHTDTKTLKLKHTENVLKCLAFSLAAGRQACGDASVPVGGRKPGNDTVQAREIGETATGSPWLYWEDLLRLSLLLGRLRQGIWHILRDCRMRRGKCGGGKRTNANRDKDQSSTKMGIGRLFCCTAGGEKSSMRRSIAISRLRATPRNSPTAARRPQRCSVVSRSPKRSRVRADGWVRSSPARPHGRAFNILQD